MTQFRFSPRPNRAREIHWRDWDDDAFQAAQRDDKLILLDISGVWCHWCHVMDETSYSDPEVIQLINTHFVPIRVETDQRPDVNRRYNLGGWPTTAFLTPSGELLTGGTYIPPAQMRGYLQQVSDAYKNDKSEILRRVQELTQKRTRTMAPESGAADARLTPVISESVLRDIRDNFDMTYGGFGDEPKFPHADALELALEKYFQSRDDSLLMIVELTLSQMASGGMYDQVAGGFFRYSTTRDWRVPHFEKMLEDHGKLLPLYAHAFQVTGNELFLHRIKSTVAYLQSTLSDQENGGFYGSQDADEAYYALSLTERAEHTAPFVDKTLYTDWNAAMVSGYFAAALISDSPAENGASSLKAFALKTLERIWREMYSDGVGLYHFQRENEPPQLLNQLGDLAQTSLAFLDAYQTTGAPEHLQRARRLCDLALDKLLDPETGGFFSEARSDIALGMLKLPDKSLAENAAMARALIRLHRLTEDQKYRDAAERTLAYFSNDYARYSFTAADYARVVNEFLNEPLHIKIVGAVGDVRVTEMQTVALHEYSPGRLVQLLDPKSDAARVQMLGYPVDEVPQSYVCVGTMCLQPVATADALRQTFDRLKNGASGERVLSASLHPEGA